MTLTEVAVILLAAAVGEGIIEFLPAPLLELWLPSTGEYIKQRTVVFNSLSAILGVAIALNFKLGLFNLLGAQGSLPGGDEILTGVLLGRGSNFIHGLVKKFILSAEDTTSGRAVFDKI